MPSFTHQPLIIRTTDNRHQWARKELQRLFPNGDHDHIMELMGTHKNINPWVNFKPRRLKRTYS